MKNLNNERLGEIYVLACALITSFFPIITILSLSTLSPLTSLVWTVVIATLFFLVIGLIKNDWKNIFNREVLPLIIGVTLINGTLFYVLFFIGLEYTTAGNAAIVATFEILFSYLFFNIWRQEHISKKHSLGMILMFLSAITILFSNFGKPQFGDLLILLAVFIAPLGNLFQKKLTSLIRTDQILFYRSLFSLPLLFICAHFIDQQIEIPSINTWLFLLINGIFFFGISKILWLESISKISVTKAISISSISVIFTVLFAFLILDEIPTIFQIVAIPLTLLGIYLLTRNGVSNSSK